MPVILVHANQASGWPHWVCVDKAMFLYGMCVAALAVVDWGGGGGGGGGGSMYFGLHRAVMQPLASGMFAIFYPKGASSSSAGTYSYSNSWSCLHHMPRVVGGAGAAHSCTCT